MPVSFRDACGFVSLWHRHLQPPVGHRYSVGVADDRHFDNGTTLEVTRLATQAGESGGSLRAAGYRVLAERPPRSGWTCPSRPRDDRGADGIARTLWEVTS